MNKKIYLLTLLFALLSASFQHARAQQFFINENFSSASGNTPPSGWSNVLISGSSSFDSWRFNNPGGRTLTTPITSPAAIFDSDNYSATGGAENVALESPTINTTGNGSVFIAWDQYFLGGFGGQINVEVFNGSTWNNVYTTTTTTGTSQNIDISSHASNRNNVKVRFRWVGDYSWYWIVDNIRVYAPIQHDLQAVSLSLPSEPCGSATDSASVVIRNQGGLSQTNFAVVVNTTGTLGGSAVNRLDSITVSASIATNQSLTVRVPIGNTQAGGTLNFTAYARLFVDQNRANDTAVLNGLSLIGTPVAPTVTSPVARCGAGSVTLTSSTQIGTDSVNWFDSPTATTPVANTKTFVTPILPVGTHTFYAASVRGGGGGGSNSLLTTLAAGNGQAGNAFDLLAASDIEITSLDLHISTTAAQNVAVYYRTGTHVGNVGSTAGWTLHHTGNVTGAGTGNTVNLPFSAPLRITGGQLMSMIVVLTTSTSIAYTNGTAVGAVLAQNTDLTIYQGTGLAFPIGNGSFQPRNWNGRIHYRKSGCPGPSVPVVVNVISAPPGARFAIGPVFQGTTNSGFVGDPDIVATNDTVSYELIPPSNSSNSGFGTQWIISDVNMATLNNSSVPSGDTATVIPSTSGNGRLVFIPSSAAVDSLYRISTTIVSLINGCDTTIERYVYVAPRPQPSFTVTSVCEKAEITFNNTSTIANGTMTYHWDFGDGNSSVLENPVHIYNSPGTYNVTLTATSNYGYSAVYNGNAIIKEIPQARFSYVNACMGNDIVFNNTTLMPPGTPSFEWDFGDGNSSINANPTHQYAQKGSYRVKVKIDVDGCVGETFAYVTQFERAIAAFSTSTQCDNKAVTFTNNSSISSGNIGFSWDFGDASGNTSNFRNPKYSYTSFGTFNVKLKVITALGSCVDSVVVPVDVIQSPSVSFTSSSACLGQEVEFFNSTIVPAGSANNYFWNFGDGNISTNDNPKHTFLGAGSYWVSLKAISSNGCVDSMAVMKDVLLNAKADFESDNICFGKQSHFRNLSAASGKALSFLWDFNNGTQSNTRDTTFVYANPGKYNVDLIAYGNDVCPDTASKEVEIFANPTSVFTVSSGQKGDGTMSFIYSNHQAGNVYNWAFGDGNKSNDQNPIHSYLFDGIFNTCLTVTNSSGCVSVTCNDVSVFRTFVNKTEKSLIKLYPNPNHGELFISSDDVDLNGKHLKITNTLGQLVFEKILDSNQIQIQLSYLMKGVYVATISSGAVTEFKQKIVIQ